MSAFLKAAVGESRAKVDPNGGSWPKAAVG